jgi:Nif-specific regulatory protein
MAGEPKRLVEVEGWPGEFSLLFEISQVLDSSLDLRTVVEPVLEAITRPLGMKFATLTLLNRQTGEIAIEAAYGLSATQRLQGKYKAGEGITGKVIETGKASILPKILRGASVPQSYESPANA